MSSASLAELASHPFLRGMLADQVARLAEIATAESVPARHRLFEEGGRARSLWLIRTGRVALDLHLPGQAPLIVETISAGEVIGLSWISPPYEWQYGAEALDAVQASRLDAIALVALCDADPVLGYQVTRRLMAVAADRLHANRIRLLDLYASPSQRTGAR